MYSHPILSDNFCMARQKRPKKPTRTRVTVQVPTDLRERMEVAAAADNRSLSNWIVDALTRALDAEDE